MNSWLLLVFRALTGMVRSSGSLAAENDVLHHQPLEIDPTLQLLGYEAIVRSALGDRDEAVQLIRTYLTASPEHLEGWTWTSHWWWRDLQDHPGFQELIDSGNDPA